MVNADQAEKSAFLMSPVSWNLVCISKALARQWGVWPWGVTTLGGYMISQLGHIPEEGEELKIGRYRAVVTGSDGRRITQILLTRLPEEQEEK